MINTLICTASSTIREAMVCINENLLGTVFVLKDKKLVGVLTDGDLRRALLGGKSLETKVDDIIKNKTFTYGHYSEPHEALLGKITDKIKIIPLVNDQFELVDYFQFKQGIHFPVTSPSLSGNELKYLTDAFLSNWISSTGQYIIRFEKEFAQYCGVNYGVATSNGTTALHLALVALGIGPGDEVIIPDLTFAATINAVLYTGAIPVIVDVEEASWCICPQSIEKHLTPKTKAIIPVHLYGQPAEMDAIMKIAKKHNLFVVEDCAEAHGAEINGKKVGSFGHINCFSFFGNKIITTGEGGMCVTSDEGLNHKLRVFRDHGMNKERRYWHDYVGFNYRMTNLQAAIGCAQLERIAEMLDKRKTCEQMYKVGLNHFKSIEFQKCDIPGRLKVTWLVSFLLKGVSRDTVIANLKKNAIDARPFFFPLTKMEIYKQYGKACPNSEKLSQIGMNLPTYINHTETEKVIKVLNKIMQELP